MAPLWVLADIRSAKTSNSSLAANSNSKMAGTGYRRRSDQGCIPQPARRPPLPDPLRSAAVRLLRAGFGLLWVLDGVLQG